MLPIAPSTYHARAARRADPARLPARARRDTELKREISRVFEENFEVYSPSASFANLPERLSVCAATSKKVCTDVQATSVQYFYHAPIECCKDIPVTQLIVLYRMPKDPEHFDKYCREVHGPMTGKLYGVEGLR